MAQVDGGAGAPPARVCCAVSFATKASDRRRGLICDATYCYFVGTTKAFAEGRRGEGAWLCRVTLFYFAVSKPSTRVSHSSSSVSRQNSRPAFRYQYSAFDASPSLQCKYA